MSFRRNLTSSLLGLIVTIQCGCGGGTPSAQPVPNVVNQPAPRAPGLAPAPNPGIVGLPAPNPESNPPEIPEDELVPPGPDDFEIVPEQLVTELAGTAPPAAPDIVELAAVGRPFHSTQMVLIEEDTGSNSVGSTAQSPTGLWDLPATAKAVPRFGIEPTTGLPARITLAPDEVEMVLIPPGVFLEGVDGQDANAAPQHSVLLEQPYYIDVLEITVDRYDAFREHFRKTAGRKFEPAASSAGGKDLPATGIKFLDAKFYARWAGKELPTEAQWERAARGDHGGEFPWGNGRPIFQAPREPGQLHPAGLFPGDQSPFGVLDMAGNAREWCLDLYTSDAFQKDVASGENPVRSPTGPRSFQGVRQQVIKGSADSWAVWKRDGLAQNGVSDKVGFRCVLNIAPAKEAPEGDGKSRKSGTSPQKAGALSKDAGL